LDPIYRQAETLRAGVYPESLQAGLDHSGEAQKERSLLGIKQGNPRQLLKQGGKTREPAQHTIQYYKPTNLLVFFFIS